MTDARYVTWGRWEAEHRALVERVSQLEHIADQLRGAEAIHTQLLERVDRLEKVEVERWQSQEAQRTEHRTRVWQTALAIVTGLVLPLGVLGVLALIHLVTRS